MKGLVKGRETVRAEFPSIVGIVDGIKERQGGKQREMAKCIFHLARFVRLFPSFVSDTISLAGGQI